MSRLDYATTSSIMLEDVAPAIPRQDPRLTAPALLAALDNLSHWIRHDPYTQEQYEASIKALADFDIVRDRLRNRLKGAL